MILDTLGPGLLSRSVRHTVSNVNYGRYREIRIVFHRCLYVEGCCICLGTNMRSHEIQQLDKSSSHSPEFRSWECQTMSHTHNT